MHKPLVTVMIPTYNQSEYIEKCINSVLDQTYTNLEIIVSDDSTDTLSKNIILTKFLNDVKYIHHAKARGRVGNYQYLLYELASGEWVINLDGDDYFNCNTFIEEAINKINQNNHIVLVFGRQTIYKLAEKRMYQSPYTDIVEGVISGDKLFLDTVLKNIEIPHLAALYKRDIALKVGFYQSNILSSDKKSLLKLLINHKVFFLDTCVGVWNHHGSNTSQNSTIDDFFLNIEMYRDLYQYAKENSNISILSLWFWKNIAKYKSIYSYIMKLLNIKAYNQIKAFLNRLLHEDFFYFIILLCDLRIYRKILRSD